MSCNAGNLKTSIWCIIFYMMSGTGKIAVGLPLVDTLKAE